jgi:hypothetical protein
MAVELEVIKVFIDRSLTFLEEAVRDAWLQVKLVSAVVTVLLSPRTNVGNRGDASY